MCSRRSTPGDAGGGVVPATSGSGTPAAETSSPLEGPVTVRVASNAPAVRPSPSFKDGERVAMSAQAALEFSGSCGRAVYRAEIGLGHAPGEPPVPWIVTNPIYVGRSSNRRAVDLARRPARAFTTIYDNGPVSRVDRSRPARNPPAPSIGARARVVEPNCDGDTRWVARAREGPYVALVVAAGPAVASADRVIFSARADKPMRLAMQVRVAERGSGRAVAANVLRRRNAARDHGVLRRHAIAGRGDNEAAGRPGDSGTPVGGRATEHSPGRQRTSLAR